MGVQRHAPAVLPPGKTIFHRIGDWVGPRAGLDGWALGPVWMGGPWGRSGWVAPRAGLDGWALGPVWMDVENLALTGIRSPHRPARSESPYLLSYPDHRSLGNAPKFIFALGAEMSLPAKYRLSYARSSHVVQLNGYLRTPPNFTVYCFIKTQRPFVFSNYTR